MQYIRFATSLLLVLSATTINQSCAQETSDDVPKIDLDFDSISNSTGLELNFNLSGIGLNRSPLEDDLERVESQLREDPDNPKIHEKMGSICHRLGETYRAWTAYSRAYELGRKTPLVMDGIDSVFGQLKAQGWFRVGKTFTEIEESHGEPHKKAELEKNRIHWIYGQWALEFRSGELHEVIDLRDSNAGVYKPTETIAVDWGGALWKVHYRERSSGHTASHFYLLEDEEHGLFKNDESVVVLQLRNAAGTRDGAAHADEYISAVRRSSPGCQHKVLHVDERTALISEINPGDRKFGRKTATRLVRLLVGPRDLHQITHQVVSGELPSREARDEWLERLKNTKLVPVEPGPE